MGFQFSNEPLKVGQILDQGIKLLISSYSAMVPVIVLIMVIGVASALMTPIEKLEDITASRIFIGVFVFLVQFYLYLFMIYRCLGSTEDASHLAVGIHSRVLKNYPIVLVSSILYGLGVAIGFLLFIIPGLIVLITQMFYVFAVMFEDKGPVAALNRSHQLVWKGNYWSTTLVFTVTAVLLGVMMFMLGGVLGLIGAGLGFEDMMLSIGILSAILSPIGQAITVCMMLVLYKDLIVRNEASNENETGASSPIDE